MVLNLAFFRPEKSYGRNMSSKFIELASKVLCAMLSGELPWMKAVKEDENYVKWTKNEHNYLPWTNCSIEAISLCRRILAPKPSERISLNDLLASKWLNKEGTTETFSVQSSKRNKGQLLKVFDLSIVVHPTKD